jgi:poly(A) polymerase
MRRIVSALPRVLAGKVNRFVRSEIFGATLDVAEAHLFARGRSVEPITRLRAAAGGPEPEGGARRRRQPSAP